MYWYTAVVLDVAAKVLVHVVYVDTKRVRIPIQVARQRHRLSGLTNTSVIFVSSKVHAAHSIDTAASERGLIRLKITRDVRRTIFFSKLIAFT